MKSTTPQPPKRKYKSIRKSTVGWLLDSRKLKLDSNHDSLIAEYEHFHDENHETIANEIDQDLEPICIAVFDGGGMRGKAHNTYHCCLTPRAARRLLAVI